MVQSLWEIVWQFLKKLNIEFPYDSIILLLGRYIYLRELKTYVPIKICSRMLRASLFIIAKSRNNLSVYQLMNGLNIMV